MKLKNTEVPYPPDYFFYNGEVSIEWEVDPDKDDDWGSYYKEISGMIELTAAKTPVEVYNIIQDLNLKEFSKMLDLENKKNAKFTFVITKLEKKEW